MKDTMSFSAVVVALIVACALWMAVLFVGVNLVHAEARRYQVVVQYRCAGHWNTATYDFRSLRRAVEWKHILEKWPRFRDAKISVGVK